MADVTDARATEPTLLIDGHWRHSSSGKSRPTINPFDASVIAHVDEATAQDAEAAIRSARHHQNTSSWSSQTFSSRAGLLSKIAALLQKNKDELARIETLDTGKTLGESKIDVDDVTAVFEFYAEEGPKLDMPKRIKGKGIPDSVVSQTVKEAVGVCVLIAPWNYPLLQICWKLAPALVAGNSCIVKPSEVTPLSTIYLHKLMLEAGVPPPAIQLLTAGGQSVGPTLTTHPDVDLVSFTGGLSTGRNIIKSCAESVKRCCVELGGKNPNVVFADVPLQIAIDLVLTAVFIHSGQVCSSGARLIIEDKGSFADDVVAGVAKRAQQIVLGNGLEDGVECGPLVSAAHLAKVKDYVALGESEGAKLLCGGKQPNNSALSKGYFFEPTVFDRCDRSMRIVQEETFGPILTVERFPAGNEELAVELANDTKFGLAAGVQTADKARSTRIARRLRHGTVWQNTYGAYTPAAEWGGFGWSGNGRELGSHGLDEYVETKHIYAEKELAMMGWFNAEKAKL